MQMILYKDVQQTTADLRERLAPNTKD
jgi:hypothetical protein